MFLVVFVTLVISIIGLFAQVYTLQIARMNAHQTALEQIMSTWHNVGVGVALRSAPDNAGTPTGCSLSTIVPTGSTGCTVGGASVSIQAGSPPVALPPGYLYPGTVYLFSTVEFQPLSSHHYVLTYATPGADGKLYSATGFSLGYTATQLLAQLERDPAMINYGTVTAPGTMTTSPSRSINKTFQSYAVPGFIQVGSVGILSHAD